MALPQLVPGMIFARDYRVVRHLSAGGMGAVYVVEQVSTQRQRALKIMLPDLVRDPKNRERFTQEATVGARVRSDHLVEVVAAGIDEETETPWMAMELLEGEELARVLEKRALAPGELLEVYRQLCHGLGAAHRGGLVHRDLKPENIFLAHARRDGAPYTVKILDFGIAKVIGESRTAAMATSTLGSPLWMAPEQAEQGAIRPATDVWALGLIAFYALTGAYYWRIAHGDFALAMLLKEIFVDPIDQASVRAALYGRAGLVPPGFDAWFARCVVRDPAMRFHDANEALAAIVPVLSNAAGIPVAAQTYPGPLPMAAPVATPAGYGTVGMTAAPPIPMATPAGSGATPMGPPPTQAQPGYGPVSQPPWAPHTASGPWPPMQGGYAAPPLPPAPRPSSSTGLLVGLGLGGIALVAVIGVAIASRGSGGPPSTTPGALPPPPATTATATAIPGYRPPQCRGTGMERDLAGLGGVVQLASGRFHSCALQRNGVVACWGWNNSRQIGNDTTEDQLTPAVVPALANVRQIAAGEQTTCALLQTGQVLCWGLMLRGARGEPTPIDNLQGATTVTVGGFHGCATVADGTVRCWGQNGNGQLGDGTDDTRFGAVPVMGLANVVQVAAGEQHTCALDRGGFVWCWGQQEQGQIGNGHRAREPVARPTLVAGVSEVAAIAAGESHTCALRRDGSVMCWGANASGAIGVAGEGVQSTAVVVGGAGPAVRIAAGYHHTCVVRRDRSLVCWGENTTCQLGVGSFQAPRGPQLVARVGPVAELGPAGMHTCVVRPDATVRCWGFNNYGQLGNGTTAAGVDIDYGQRQ
jgi:alpha-tubulin suppressor-like RCC1 family protein/tRNA A-37 threonylcarbamoyl transferase component Bud32